MSSDHHAGDLVLRLPKTTLNWDFEQSALLSKSSKLDKKVQVQKCFDLEIYTQQQHIFFCFVL